MSRRSVTPLVVPAAVVLATVVGFVSARLVLPVTGNRSFLWIAGRSLGLAAYLCLVLLVVLGIWLRHPARHRWPLLHPETRLRLHAALGTTVVVMLAGHVTALAADRYAGVGWLGAVLPGASRYRQWPVALGVVAAYAVVAVVASAALGGRRVGVSWLAVHRLALPALALVWFHGVLAGSDTPRLRLWYGISGLLVVALAATRAAMRPAAPAAVTGSGGGSAGASRAAAPSARARRGDRSAGAPR